MRVRSRTLALATAAMFTACAADPSTPPLDSGVDARPSRDTGRAMDSMRDVHATTDTNFVPDATTITDAHADVLATDTAQPVDSGIDPEMAFIAAGEFSMGCNSTKHCYPDEEPPRRIRLSAYWIDRTEVTRAAYRDCVRAGACTPIAGDDLSTLGNHPVSAVTWPQADTYCRSRGKRLPTSAQWERATRGTEAMWYPWGMAPPDCARVNALACNTGTEPVGSHPSGSSPEGVHDLLGNVWEWNEDWYDEFYYRDAPAVDPPSPASGPGRIYRGGAFPSDGKRLDPWLRYFPDGTAAHIRRAARIGFRCVR